MKMQTALKKTSKIRRFGVFDSVSNPVRVTTINRLQMLSLQPVFFVLHNFSFVKVQRRKKHLQIRLHICAVFFTFVTYISHL